MTTDVRRSGDSPQFEAYFESMSGVVVEIGLDERVIWGNAAGAAVTGVGRDHYVGTPFLEIDMWAGFAPVCSRMAAAFARAAGGERVIYDEELVVRGVRETVNLTFSPISGDGDLVGSVLLEAKINVAQRRLARSLAEAQRHAEIGSWTLDAEGRVTWSAEVFRITGFDPAEGAPGPEAFLARVHPEDRAELRATLSGAMAAHEGWQLRFRLLHRDGRERVIDGGAYPEVGVDGSFVRMSGYLQDVTRHAEREQALRLAEERARDAERLLAERRLAEARDEAERRSHRQLQQIIDNSPSPIYVKDRERRYRVINAAAAANLDLDPAQVLGKRNRDLFVAETAARLDAMDRRVVEEGAAIEQEESVEFIPGKTRHLILQKFPIRELDGTISGVGGISTDVTEFREAEAARQRRAGRQVALTDLYQRVMGDGSLDELMKDCAETLVAELDVFGAHVFELSVDGSMLELRVGAGPEVPEGLAVSAAAATPLGKALSSPEPVMVEDVMSDPRFDLPDARVARSGIAVSIEGGSGRFGVLTAYSPEPRAYADDDVHFVEAVGRVLATGIARERAAGLARHLEASQRLESVGKLAGGVAHDFNNLLAIILNYAGFVADGLEDRDEDMRGDLAEIRRAAERAAELTRQLLLFSRRDATQPELLDVNDVVEEAEGVLRRTAGDGLELELDLAPGLEPILAARAHLHEILFNLVVNGRDAMPDGGTVWITTTAVDVGFGPDDADAPLPGRYLRLDVRDDGAGMRPDVLDRALEPFFTTKGVGAGGTGLGLSAVYGIVRRAGGNVRIESELGVGTTVTVLLPCATAPGAPRPAPEQSERSSSARILVVEDEPGVREVARRALVAGGHDVIVAASAEEALVLMASESDRVDLLLTDVVMPGMSGAELARELDSTGVPVVYMSGYTDDIIGEQGVLESGTRLIQKPFSRDELLAAIAHALAGDGRETR